MTTRRIDKSEARVTLVPFAEPQNDHQRAWNWALEHRRDLSRDYIALRRLHITHYGAESLPGPASMAVLDSMVEAWIAARKDEA